MKIFVLLFIIACFLSCKKETPVACISAMDLEYEVDDEVDFFAICSENGYSYVWDLGDGSTSSEKNPTHIYTSPGTYTTELKVYSKKEKTFETASRTITVQARPTFVTITSITVYSFTEKNPYDASWDVGGNADIRLSVIDGTTTYVDGTEVVQDANFNQSYSFYGDFPVVLPYSEDYLVVIYDEDGTTDDLVDVLDFIPSKYSLNDETSININTGSSSVRLKLQWTY